MSSGVRSKIASYEAQAGNTTPTRQSSSLATSTSSSLGMSTPTKNNHPSPLQPSPSTKAAQNRVSRIRQEQSIKDGKSQSLVEKQIEKRRIQKEQRVNLSRRTEYEPSYADAKPPTEEETAKSTKDSASPSRGGGGSRLSKMQRMQRMLGHDPSKKAAATTTTTTTTTSGGRKSMTESSTVSAATTEVVKNSSTSSSNPVQPRRQRQTLMQSRVKRHSTINYKQSPTGLEKVPSHQQAQAFSGLPSPTTSDVDTAFGQTDQSIDPDDEATLTSVRQIMNGDNTEAQPRGDRTYHYQNLQTFEDSTRASSRSVQVGSGRSTNQVPKSTSTSGVSLSRKDRSKSAWPHEEKSDKGPIPRVFRTTSSSDYDTDGDVSKQSNAIDGPTHSQLSEVNEFFTQQPRYNPQRRMVDDDENTFDYGDRDDASNASASFAMRQRRLPMDPPPPQSAPSNEWKETKQAPSSLINKDDLEHYTKSLGSPTVRMGAGVLAGVTIGCVMLGPAGLLAGAALVGLGIGAMQIPEEERQKIQLKVQETAHQVQEKALDATEKLSNRCAATYEESGVAEHLPPCFAVLPGASGPEVGGGGKEQVSIAADDKAPAIKETLGPPKAGYKGAGGAPPLTTHDGNHPRAEPTNSGTDRVRNKKVACLRNVRILPAGQIHGLDPSAQPKAWLDVVASGNTSEDEKIEALEEILILAKDKRRAQILLEEGILDSLVWTLDRYMEKVHHRYDNTNWANPTITPNEIKAAKLAASCCVTLGKTHCAAIHTEGDMQLISLYESGSVSEERQVALMLHEIPHHVRITKVDDPTVVIPKKEIFGLRQLSLQQAEEFAQSIKAVIDGKL